MERHEIKTTMDLILSYLKLLFITTDVSILNNRKLSIHDRFNSNANSIIVSSMVINNSFHSYKQLENSLTFFLLGEESNH